ATGQTSLVSAASDGTPGNRWSFYPAVAVAPGGSVYVAFYSYADNLVAGDTNGFIDVFVKDLATAVTSRASTADDGTQGDSDSSDPSLAVAPDGSIYVAFDSGASNLVAGDTNGTSDVFLYSQITTDTTVPVVTNPGDQTSDEGSAVSLAIAATDADG